METQTKPAPHVALVKPEPDTKGFERSERIILVDGVRWGRTYVAHHGMHGKSYTFKQDGGEILMQDFDPPSRNGRMTEVKVRSMHRRRVERDGGTYRPTEELVLEKAEELVRTGMLRDPAVVRAEAEERHRQLDEAEAQHEAEKKEKFRAKARECLGQGVVVAVDEAVDKIVAAMEWAQSQ